MKVVRLTPNQLALMAAILGVSNSGSDHLFEGHNKQFTPDSLRLRYADKKRPLDVDGIVVDLVSGLCENDSMLENFQDEARSWVDVLRPLSIAQVKNTWKRYAEFVDVVK